MKDYFKKIINIYNKDIINKESIVNGKKQNFRVFKEQSIIDELSILTTSNFAFLKNQFPDVTIKFKYGMVYNLASMPWIQIYYLNKNSKGTSGNYCGIHINTDKKNIELWLGFGMSNLKKKEIYDKKEEYLKQYRNLYGLDLDRNFSYDNSSDAIYIIKEYDLEKINDKDFQDDILYLIGLYVNAENSNLNGNAVEEKKATGELFTPDRKNIGVNIIYKGFPGTGKSTLVTNEYLRDKDGNDIDPRCYERITFYPEYTNAEFIGTIRPVIKQSQPTYKFIPGPFSVILKRAIENPKTNFFLIIEELNRGNAETIFGDVFQLLDRDKETKESTFAITNSLIADYVYGDETKKIRIPGNLSIIATMNVSDENVQTLDTAFERRWNPIWVLGEKGALDEKYIKGLNNIKWGIFRKKINEKIVSQQGMLRNEDKQLGAYFINEEMVSSEKNNNKDDREKFLYKVILYLYNKICKYDKGILFDEKVTSITVLIKTFLTNDYLSVFNNEIRKELSENYEENNN